MVAAATVLCLDTNVHRQSTASKSFVSLGGSVVEQKMALNFGVSAAGQLLTTSPPSADAPNKPQLDTLIVSTNNHVRQISPGTAALQKINEVLARNSSSATSSPLTPLQQPSSTDENSPSEVSVQAAEQYKEQLMQSIDRVSCLRLLKRLEEGE